MEGKSPLIINLENPRGSSEGTPCFIKDLMMLIFWSDLKEQLCVPTSASIPPLSHIITHIWVKEILIIDPLMFILILITKYEDGVHGSWEILAT